MSASEIAVLETRVDVLDERMDLMEENIAAINLDRPWLTLLGAGIVGFAMGLLTGLLIWTHTPWG